MFAPRNAGSAFSALLATLCLLVSAGGGAALVQPAAIGPYLDGVFPVNDPTGGGLQPPATLSGTGAFTNLTTLAPHPGLLPYDVNAPLWSDAAGKSRWIAVPHDGTRDAVNEKVTFSANAAWSFPAGTVLVKHFEINTDENNPSQRRRLETRFLVITSGDYYGVTYRWRPDGSEADLLPDSASEVLTIQEAGGGTRQQTWDYPGRADCRTCHNVSAGTVIGPRTHQLNGDYTYPGESTPENQLAAWNSINLFTPALEPAEISTYLKSHAIDDGSASLEARVRSYLDSNCAICHHPGNLSTSFDLRYTTALESQNLINGSVLYDLGVPGARVVKPQSLSQSIMHTRMNTTGVHKMPPIGRNVIDAQAVSVLEQWIMSLPLDPPPPGNSSPAAGDDEGLTIVDVPTQIPAFGNDLDADGDSFSLFSSTQPSNGSVTWNPSGVAAYTPNSGFIGLDTFAYSVVDEHGAVSNTATVSVTVSPAASSGSVTFLDGSNLLANPAAASGVGMAVVDMDQDGRDDIVHFDDAEFLHIDYQQPGGATFLSQYLSDFNFFYQWGLAVGDADNNGYPDLVTGGYYDGLHYFRADATGTTYTRTDLSSPAVFLQAVSFADIDADGWLDIFACHDDAESAKFRNLGDGSMTADAGLIDTATVPASDNSGNYGVVWSDYDGDGDLDMYLSKCRQGVSSASDPRRINMLFRNNGDGSYSEVAGAAGLNFGEQSWVADFGDIDNDGDLDCFVGNHMAPSYLMRNNGNGTFTDITATSGISVSWKVVQSVFRDFNNDGWLDLLLTGEEHGMWLNDGDGTFTKTANPFSSNWIESCAVGDLNSDGFPDVYAGYADLYNTPNWSKPDRMFLSSSNGNGFLSIRLEGVQSNKLASGARLELQGPWGTQVREVRSGEGYGVTHSFTQIFGLGNQPVANQLTVRWPSGTIDMAQNVAANQFLTLREGSTAAPALVAPGDQSTPAGGAVSLQLVATDPTGDPLTYSAINLPYGLTLDSSTGLITGPASQTVGTFTVTVTASDGWSSDLATFAWTITPPDADNDGLPDDWEIAHGLNSSNPADALIDQDEDGAIAIAEYLLGKDPNVMEVMELGIATQVGGSGLVHPVLSWSHLAEWWNGATVQLERAEDPASGWSAVSGASSSNESGGIVALQTEDAMGFSWEGSSGPDRAFYRVRIAGVSNGTSWEYVTPVSAVMRRRCPQGTDVRCGIPLRERAVSRARVGSHSVAGSILTITEQGTPDWLAGSFDETHFLRFENGTMAGRTYKIRATTSNSVDLYLPAGEPAGAPASGDRFAIFPGWTLATLFGHTGLVFDDSVDFRGINRGTEILLFKRRALGTARSAQHVFYRLPSPGGWRSTADAFRLENDFVIAPDTQFAMRTAGPQVTGDGWMTVAGTVESGKIATLLMGDAGAMLDTVTGLQAPAAVKLRDLGLLNGSAFAGSSGTGLVDREDELLLYDNRAVSLNGSPVAIYFYDLNAAAWKNAASPAVDAGDEMIPAAAGLVIRKAAGASGGVYWRVPPQE